MKTYTSQHNETLGMIAKKFRLPSWKYLHEINKAAIGDNPDILNEGTELTIPHWETSSGAQLIKEKGAEPETYCGGLRFVYPWVAVSCTIAHTDGTVYRELDADGKELAEFSQKKSYEIKDADTGKVLMTGNISTSEEIRTIVPDVKKKVVFIDGKEYQLWNGEKS
jgi:hypothetical protein